jgi:hypothetical protein
VVDGHYQAVEQLDDAIDDLQTHLFRARTSADIRRRAYDLGASLAALRGVAVGLPSMRPWPGSRGPGRCPRVTGRGARTGSFPRRFPGRAAARRRSARARRAARPRSVCLSRRGRAARRTCRPRTGPVIYHDLRHDVGQVAG